MIALVDLAAQYQSIKQEVDNAVFTTLESGHFILGPQVRKIEESVALYLGVKYAIGVASGTDALVIAMRALNISKGDEVIVPAYTFFATVGAVMAVGAKPVFVDIDLQNYEIDTNRIESLITPKTRAIIPVHLFGHPVDMSPILDISRTYKLKVVEDNAQAFGAEYLGKKTGSLGDIGCLSFYPTKNLGAFGDAGMIVTNNLVLAERAHRLRTHGWKKKYYSEEVGYNSRLDTLQAAILQVKLPHVDAWNKKRRILADRYREYFAPFGIFTPTDSDWGKHVFHLYIIRCSKRDELQVFLKQKGIASEVYYPLPPHLSIPCKKYGYKIGDFPNAERATCETLALPLYPELTDSQQNKVIESVIDFIRFYQ